mmetsp:Transcript_32289/g.64403  ORF Transcript_32289/g.64403 Transcript_32289/m.64403 type:complete len:83 (+) Transcript_32289:382-630(+)
MGRQRTARQSTAVRTQPRSPEQTISIVLRRVLGVDDCLHILLACIVENALLLLLHVYSSAWERCMVNAPALDSVCERETPFN